VKVAPSTYYARKQRPASARQKRDQVVKEEISRAHANNYDAFGARKLHMVLNREPDPLGLGHVARCTIERLMKDLRLHGIRRAKAPNTTRSAPRENCPADLVDRHFAAFAPDRLWVADIPLQAGGAPLPFR
jgi:putative transposase